MASQQPTRGLFQQVAWLVRQLSAAVNLAAISVPSVGKPTSPSSAIKATKSTYSIRSCPSSSFQSLFTVVMYSPFALPLGAWAAPSIAASGPQQPAWLVRQVSAALNLAA